MEALFGVMIFAIVVAVLAVILMVVVREVLAALNMPSHRLVNLGIGLVALLIILRKAWPVLASYM